MHSLYSAQVPVRIYPIRRWISSGSSPSCWLKCARLNRFPFSIPPWGYHIKQTIQKKKKNFFCFHYSNKWNQHGMYVTTDILHLTAWHSCPMSANTKRSDCWLSIKKTLKIFKIIGPSFCTLSALNQARPSNSGSIPAAFTRSTTCW